MDCHHGMIDMNFQLFWNESDFYSIGTFFTQFGFVDYFISCYLSRWKKFIPIGILSFDGIPFFGSACTRRMDNIFQCNIVSSSASSEYHSFFCFHCRTISRSRKVYAIQIRSSFVGDNFSRDIWSDKKCIFGIDDWWSDFDMTLLSCIQNISI